MLLRFRATNYRSIRDSVELNFRTRGNGTTTVAAIYGANASGKSNFLDAIFAANRAVRDSHTRWQPSATPPPHEPFILDSACAEHPSVFEYDFVVDDTRYQYGFAFGAKAVTDEWLYTFPEGRRRTMFEREGQHFQFGRALKGPNRLLADLVRPNSLFLSAAASNNHEMLMPIYEWFASASFGGVRAGAPADSTTTERLLASGDRDQIQKLLTLADLGISGVSVREEEVDDGLAAAMETFLASIANHTGLEGPEPGVSRTQTIIEFEHRTPDGAATKIPYQEESRGTQMWFAHIGPVITALHNGSLLVIDELDASLHPRLSREIIQLFADRETNPKGAQLVFSTHDTSLLSQLLGDVLARDQVWFTEKEGSGATTLYPLSEFHPRKGEALERGYLLGRYGAVPIVDFTEIAEHLKIPS